MTPTTFPSVNLELTRGESHPENTGTLPVYTDGEVCVSCWEPTTEERAAIAAGGPVWLTVLTGQRTQPPVALTTEDPFGEEAPRLTRPLTQEDVDAAFAEDPEQWGL